MKNSKAQATNRLTLNNRHACFKRRVCTLFNQAMAHK